MNKLRRLLTPASGLLGQGMRYAMAGAVVTVVYLLTTTFLAVVVGMPFRDALVIGFTLQLAVHFTLQRTFVWVYVGEFALPFRHQARRYLTSAGAQSRGDDSQYFAAAPDVGSTDGGGLRGHGNASHDR